MLNCRIVILVAVALLAALHGAGSDEPSAKTRQALERLLNEFVSIAPGEGKFPRSFVMGTADGPAEEQPVHKVTFAHSFALAKYEVTQELYETVMGANPSRWKGPRNSVEKVSWDEANEFCAKATRLLHAAKMLAAKESLRLPTEAEWEYACRAGTTTKFSFGDSEKDLGVHGWFTGNAKGNDPPVGAKKANPWGLYDMHGYVWEWCADAWQPNYRGAPGDGSARKNGQADRVLRGGAWTEVADHCRSAYRHHAPAETRSDAIGFRCVKTIQK